MSKDKRKINWKRTFKNNKYMLGFIVKSEPGILIMQLIDILLEAINSFLLNIYLYKYALNALQEGRELKGILITLGCMLLYSVLFMVFHNISNCYMSLKCPKVEAYIQNLLQKKASEVELACFENSSFFDTYVKATSEAYNRCFSVLNNVLSFIWVIFNIIAIGALVISIEPIFLIFAVVPLLFTIIFGKKRNKTRYDYDMETQEAARQRDYVRRTFYLIDFSKEMRLTEIWKVMFRRMHDSVIEMKDIVRKYGYKLMFFRYLFDFAFDVVVDTGTIILAAYKTLVSKNMMIGDCFVVINSISNISGNLNYAGDVILRLDEHSLYVDNLREFLEYEITIPEIESAPIAPTMETLELCKLIFKYENGQKAVLKNINIKINKGERIAIVGHNGAGKTTFVKLLQRLYDPSEGKILLNGVDIKEYRLSTYRSLFGTVFQDYKLFANTVAENVLLRGNITDEDKERIKDSLIKSGIYDKINSLPQGIDTTVTKEFDSDGVVFSGGEAQKLSIARIFAGEQEIVIMDEPTSALDPIAEEEMYRNMFEACKGKTVIFISHRLSSATMADRVYMFENGEVIESGTHSELVSQEGKYADMWHKQADTYANNIEEG